jgi:hypothetical protein
MQIRLTTTLFFGAAALIAGGCAPFTDSTTGGGNTGCVAAITEDDPGSQIAINTPSVKLGVGTGTTAQLAEAFLVTSTQVVPEVQLKLDVVTPSQTQVTSSINVQIQEDSLVSTAGNATTPTTPGLLVSSGTISASSSILASTVNAAPSSSSTNPAFYDFCFSNAIGVNCPTAGIGATTAGVTLNAGQYYWIVATTTSPGTATSFVEWRGTGTSTTDFFGYVFLNSLTWLPVNGASTSNFNFDFKLGC